MTTNTINWTERDVRCAAAVLGRASDEGFALPTLTDEEVVALDGVQREQIVALPWLSAQEARKDIMCAVALRGLLAKELVYPVIFEGESEPSRLHAVDDITGALTLRRSGDTVVSIERTVSTGRRWLYAYTHAEGVLLEEVDDGGLHGFTVISRDALPGRMAAFVDPEGAAAQDTEAVSYTETEFEEHAPTALADTLAASNVVAFKTDSDEFPTVTVYTGPSGVQVLTPSAQGESVSLELRGTSRETLTGIFGSLAGLS
ncbi:hypothetical protein BIU82_15630 [Arthrobacter sp. SW1]|uniref:hypothetical protein n=1 Tax=Arthrobacter sp. SW1 TaxID=1920889 RepID=UPI000877D736|nr:hypothetical protein [Arthrobacter sp. SW1]OFI39074.1 hypothetical protein BIU82_15630 [Arthrobacter sp. SW1]